METERTASAEELVQAFVHGASRYQAYEALVELGHAALPAVRQGLKSDDWQVRRWCAICLDRMGDADALEDLVPLLEDPKSQVRLWAVHSLACDHCKADVICGLDVVPLLIQRVETDTSVRVRRMAVIMLSTELADRRAVPVLEDVARDTSDPRLRMHALEGLERLWARLGPSDGADPVLAD